MMSIEYLRQFKIGQFAIFDIVISYVGIAILSPILIWFTSKFNLKIPVISWLWFTLPIAVIFHIIFGQSTPLMKMLTDPWSYQFYVVVLFLIFMIHMGLRKIHKIK